MPTIRRLQALLKQCDDLPHDIEQEVAHLVVCALSEGAEAVEERVVGLIERIERVSGRSADFDGVILPVAPEVPTCEPSWSSFPPPAAL